MSYSRIRQITASAGLITLIYLAGLASRGAADNLPPSVSILWPTQSVVFSSEFIKFKSAPVDPDGTITQVQFFLGTNLLGVVTNSPWNVLAQMPQSDSSTYSANLRAVATDNVGATTESAPVGIAYSGTQPAVTVVEMESPPQGAVLAAPATFVFSAELLAGSPPGGTAQIKFLLGTNSLGFADAQLSATAPPSSITVTNLPEGDYQLNVSLYFGGVSLPCVCYPKTNTIHVVNLREQNPAVGTNGQFQFQVLTPYPGQETVIQTSPDLLNWVSVRTNYPPTNLFPVTDLPSATEAQRFYRVFLPPP